MRVLALDTTTAAGSVAVVDDDEVLIEEVGDATRSHAERLPGDILRVVERSGITIASVDLFAIAAGPGTFTGLRIGIATIQGLAFVNGKRVVPVSALMALAAAASREEPAGRTIGAWMDAHRRDVFSALFHTTDRSPCDPDGLIEIEGAAVGEPAATLTRWEAAGHLPDILVGDGAIVFAATVPAQISTLEQLPLAAVIGRMAARRARAGDTVDPAGIQPLYIRRPDAEIARDAAAETAVQPRDRKPKP
jgi:tRNA threonylcarbamoyladenosine biosynthesis protein TsaB